MNPLYLSVAMVACFANDNDAYIPELWANEGLAILVENMVAANLVHRDFESEIKQFGDVVNTRRPGTRKIRRKTDADSYVAKDAVATNVRVPLDQWFYDSFVIKDGEASKSFQELRSIHLLPVMQNIARGVDRAVLGRVHEFIKGPTQRTGRLLNLSSSNAKDYVLDARELLNTQNAYVDGRNLVLAPNSETALLKTDMFVKANERGDGGTALTKARLGEILGFQTYMDQNVNFLGTTSVDVATGTVTNALAAGGSGSQAVSIVGYNVNVGEFAIVAGNDQPTHVTARTLNMADTTAVTLNEANKFATAAAAVITVYKKADVQGAYPAGHSAAITIDGYTAGKAPQKGQLIAFGTGGSRKVYTIIETEANGGSATDITLDRPLEIALADNDLAFPGPAGAINLAFHRDAIALVSRPLAMPEASLGVKAGMGVWDGVGMRVVMQYDSSLGGTRVNVDILAGVAILDLNLGVLLLG